MPHRCIDHVYEDIGVRGIPVAVSAGLCVFLRLLQILLFHDLFALDHGVSAVRAAGAVLIVHDLGAGDLFLHFGRITVAPESQSTGDPADEFYEEYDRHYKDHEEEDQP